MKALRGVLNDDDLREAPAEATLGIIDPRYWHDVLATFPAPALPRREFGIGVSEDGEFKGLSP